ncbi:MAG: GlsB/YeaQ/YmgE family stress response membrane protein [Caldilineaceae bacterium]|nr:GlsB/YeaQ/YmgE family stress response membrane protein [Caldilineaceae bacterium]
MGILEFIILVVIAAICGALGQAIAGYSLGGMVITTIVGFIGALLGTWLARAMGLPELLMVNVGGQPFPIIWAIIGSALFAAIIAMFTRRPRSYA